MTVFVKGFLFVKGHGTYLTGPLMEQLGMHEAPSPAEIGMLSDEANPFHHYYDERTGSIHKFGDDVIKRNTYQAMIEGMARSIVTQKPQYADEIGRIKIELRKIANEAAHDLNVEQGKKHHSKPEWRGEDAFPDVVFSNVNDPNSVNPELVQGGYSQFYHKMPTEKDEHGDWYLGEKGDRWHPKSYAIYNTDGKIPEFYASNARGRMEHRQSGHMSEGGRTPILSHFVFKACQKYGVRTPKSFAQGHINPKEYAWYVDKDGREHPVWEHYEQHRPPDYGRGKVTSGTAVHGPFDLIHALVSMDPAFFMPVHKEARGRHGKQVESGELVEGPRHKFARRLLGGILNDFDRFDPSHLQNLDATLVDNFSKSYVVNMLYNGQMSVQQTGKKGKSQELAEDFKKVLGIPETETVAQRGGQAAERAFKEYKANSNHMHIQTGWLEGLKSHPKARGGLNDALYFSLRAQTSQDGPRIRDMLKDKYPIGYEDGEELKRLLTHYWRENKTVPIRHEEAGGNVVMIPPEDIHDPRPRKSQVVDAAPYVLSQQSGYGEGQETKRLQAGLRSMGDFTGNEGDDNKSFDSIHSLMESLQSADARMDDMIVKSLPAMRRFSINDDVDCRILCSNYNIETRDLHYINSGTGDWSRLAEDLKIKTNVVKGVKVALRW